MHKKIVISFPQKISVDQKATVTERVNMVLAPIIKEVDAWNGFVDYVEAEAGYFVAIAKCDNEEIREMMQLLIDEDVFHPKNVSSDNKSRV